MSVSNEPRTGTFLGVPYDWRRHGFKARLKQRWWNPAEPRLFTPRAFGAGWDVNFYWVSHPGQFVRGRRAD